MLKISVVRRVPVDPTPSDTPIETLLSTSACKGGPLVFSTSTDGQNLCARNRVWHGHRWSKSMRGKSWIISHPLWVSLPNYNTAIYNLISQTFGFPSTSNAHNSVNFGPISKIQNPAEPCLKDHSPSLFTLETAYILIILKGNICQQFYHI